MDKYSRSLARYLEMRVQVRLGTYTTVFGNLVEVNSEFLRLENSRVVDEYDESDWGSKITEGDPDMIAASSDGESLIRMNYVSSVTCMSDQLEFPRSSPSPRSSDSTIALRELANESTSQDVFARPLESEDATLDLSHCTKSGVESEGSYQNSLMDEICIEFGANLIQFAASSHDGKLLQRIETLRSEIDTLTGFVLPPVRIRPSLQLDANEYRILVHEIECGRFQLQPKMQPLTCDGVKPSEPIDCPTIVATHLKEIVLGQTEDLLRFETVQKLLDRLSHFHPVLVAELIPSQLSIWIIHFVLKHLLRERVSIRNLPLILEAISDAVGEGLNNEEIVRQVRRKCGRIVCGPYITPDNMLSAVTLSADGEAVLSEGNGDKLDYDQLGDFIERLNTACHPHDNPTLPILVANVSVRERIWDRLNVNNIFIPVIGTNEVPRNIQVRVVEKIHYMNN